MNKTQLIAHIADACNISKRLAGDVLNCFIATVVDQVTKGNDVAISGLCTVKRGKRGARKGRNPRTGEVLQIKEANYVKFSVAAPFKKAVKATKVA